MEEIVRLFSGVSPENLGFTTIGIIVVIMILAGKLRTNREFIDKVTQSDKWRTAYFTEVERNRVNERTIERLSRDLSKLMDGLRTTFKIVDNLPGVDVERDDPDTSDDLDEGRDGGDGE